MVGGGGVNGGGGGCGEGIGGGSRRVTYRVPSVLPGPHHHQL